jgi:hypothetical protein
MKQVDAVGFDMDWTLAQYNRDFDLLAFDGAKEKLVNWLGLHLTTHKLVPARMLYFHNNKIIST